ncbi:transcriptional regulator with XRE-family HTH domain [Actinoplanes tereljensis]|uniref:Transcriptional regulator n=1 Tax=Paractinoplanes tereljensis TaxID=571912 RepID=A0A919NMW9_9ACTN|nr:helix-turn-helix transcriptional regulator [Actinoplanes tereljensis]GIF21774.1 transcriptional regulator [Actinoplanes tereljensis]
MNRAELAGFLRSRRERIAPGDVGLPTGRRRRTPGLRREEVAQLAFISTDYYTRLEQARSPHPSREVLSGLARALRLSDAERDHLHHLAGEPPAPPAGPSREVRQSILDLIARLPQSAATVISASFEVIAWNDLAAALMEDFSVLPRRDRNLARMVFLGGPGRLYQVSDADRFAQHAAHRLRATAARYPGDPEVAELVRDLRAGSERFRELWASHDVTDEPTLVKTFQHTEVGPVTVNCDVLDIADRDQRLVIYTATPGSPSEEALALLSVIGGTGSSPATSDAATPHRAHGGPGRREPSRTRPSRFRV